MNIIVNGHPKSGTHALLKAVELLGQPAEIGHFYDASQVPEGISHFFHIKRDPRNVLLSWMRFNGVAITDGMYMSKFRGFDGSMSFVESASRYTHWLNGPVYNVKFEELIANESVMQGIAGYLGVDYLENAFLSLPGLTPTWTGEYSDYTTIWTPAVDNMWLSEGGAELQAAWGY